MSYSIMFSIQHVIIHVVFHLNLQVVGETGMGLQNQSLSNILL